MGSWIRPATLTVKKSIVGVFLFYFLVILQAECRICIDSIPGEGNSNLAQGEEPD